MKSSFTLTFTVNEQDENKLLREFLYEKELSKTALTDIKFSGGKIIVNSQEVTVRKRLKTGDQVEVYFPPEKIKETLLGETIPLTIIYEDDYLLVVNKQAGMNTIPSREHPTGSLANALIGYFRKQKLWTTTHIVTRLDRDTSGLVLVAKHRHIHHLLSKLQQKGDVKRRYAAFAEGKILLQEGSIVQPIARKESSIIERMVHPDGQYACTHFEVVAHLSDFTYLHLELETGRTHQIRVHLSFLGHPLVGDDLYGGNVKKISRQALHCFNLKFFHPINKKWLEFSVPLPEDMKKLMK